MYEVTKFIKDENYADRILPLVQKDTDIFDIIGRNKYIQFWQDKFKEVESSLSDLDELNRVETIKELKKIENIQRNIGEFLSIISDMNTIVFDNEINKSDFDKIYSVINPNECFLGEYSDLDGYFVLNVPRTIVYKVFTWWAKELKGYTEELNLAKVFTKNEIVSFFQKEGRIRFDELENGKAVFSRDFDVSAFNNFLQLASITPSIDKDFLLANLDCLSENGQMTNAGVLFFSKSTEFLLLQATVTCVLYKGIERIHVLDRKDFSGNIIDSVENAVMFVLRHTNLEYKIEKLRREEIPEIPEVALREAVVNAVCHRDYFEKGANVMIEIFDDRLEISNPGGLPSGLTRKSFGTKSVVRNPVIASLLHRAGYIEKIGTGIKRIENTVKEHGRGSVIFSFDSFFTVFFSRVKATEKTSVKTAPDIENATQKTTQETEKTTQETTQEMIFRLIKTNPAITRKGLAEKTGLTPDGVKYHLNKLRGQGLVRHVGATKKGYWEVMENYE